MSGSRRARRAVAVIVSASILAFSGCAFPGDAIDDGEGILGTYSVNGVDPVGIEYSGTVTIVDGDRSDEYIVEWVVTGTVQRGVGRLVGDQLDVEWDTITSARGDSSGTASYVVDDEGVLRGTRLVDGVAEAGTEEIFPEA